MPADPNRAVRDDLQVTAARVLQEHGRTFVDEAHIDLADTPEALWQLLVLAQLLSTRIRSGVALATARQLWAAGWTSPAALRTSTWQQRVDALGRGGYRRYDFSTSTRLAENLSRLRTRWDDDLRTLRLEAAADAGAAAKLLQEFDGIGPAGASIFLREVQAVWPEFRPSIDTLVRKGAERVGLPTDADVLAALVEPNDMARFAAALARVAKLPASR